jgi:hypothetical protein
MDEPFERLWQPLKGISIKNIYDRELSYPHHYLTRIGDYKVEFLRECQAELKKTKQFFQWFGHKKYFSLLIFLR